MAEEMVELGFEGLDKFADRYWDRTYDHLPAAPRFGKKKRLEQQQRLEAQRQYQQQYQQQPQERQIPQQNSSRRPDKGNDSSRSSPDDVYSYESDPEMYAPSRPSEYGRDDRSYYESQRGEQDYRAPGPGFRVAQNQSEYGGTRAPSTQVTPYTQQSQVSYSQRRPGPQRRRSSWSPPRSEGQGRRDSRRPRSRSRSRSQSIGVKHRLIATVGGALVGGLAGNQVGKGKKYDTAATVAGAILGGMGAREASDHWEKAREKKKEHQNGYEGDYGYGGDGRRDRRRDDRYERDDGYYRDERYDGDERRRY